jgi:hypothetical protein
MGQLHQFGIVQTNIQVQGKRQKKGAEGGNRGAHSWAHSGSYSRTGEERLVSFISVVAVMSRVLFSHNGMARFKRL